MSNSIINNYTEIFFASILLMFVVIVFGVAGYAMISAACLIAAILLLFLPNIKSVIISVQYSFRKKTISAQKPRQSLVGMLHSRLLRYSFFADMGKNMRQTALSGAISSGSLVSPTDTSKNIIVIFAISLVASVVISLVGVLLFGELLSLCVLVIPLLVRLYPYISNMLNSSDMTSLYDSELAYFLAYLQISTLSGFGLYDSMYRLLDKNIFLSIEHDTRILQKWISFDGYSESFAINRLALHHSHDTFQSFLFSYSDILKTNPDGLKNFIMQTADEEFEKIIGKDEKKITKISSMFIYGAMAMIMAPVMMLTMMFLQSDADTITLITYAIFLIPIVFTMYVFFTNHSQSDVSLGSLKRSVLFGMIGVPWYAITQDILTSITISVCMLCVVNGRYTQRQITSWRSKADGFPKFIRDLIEKYKTDPNFVISIKKILSSQNKEKKYGMFYHIIHDIESKLYVVNDKPQDLFYDVTIQSSRIRLFMFILQTVFDGGHHSSVSSLERIHSFSVKLNAIKNSMDDSLKMSSIILYASPSIFFLAMVGLSSMLMSFTGNVPEISDGIILGDATELFVQPDYSSFLNALKPAVLIMSVCAGLVISKVSHSTFVATLPLGICLGIAFVIITGWDFFFSIVSGLIGGAA